MKNLIIFCNSSIHLLSAQDNLKIIKNNYICVTNVNIFAGSEREVCFKYFNTNYVNNTTLHNSYLKQEDLNNILKTNNVKIIINQSFGVDTNADVMELFFTIQTITNYLSKNNKKNKIYLNLLHFPYARQDKEKDYLSSSGKECILKILSVFQKFIAKIQVCDEHSNDYNFHNKNKTSNQTNCSQKNNKSNKATYQAIIYNQAKIHFKINNILPVYLFEYIKQNFKPEDSCIIMPDFGASKRLSSLLPSNFISIVLCKKRNANNEVYYIQNHEKISPNVVNFLIIDDMLCSGETCAKTINYVTNAYNLDIDKTKFYVLCSHFFSFAVKLENCTNICKIITTNSLPNNFSNNLNNSINNTANQNSSTVYNNAYKNNLNLASLLKNKGQDYVYYIDIFKYFFN